MECGMEMLVIDIKIKEIFFKNTECWIYSMRWEIFSLNNYHLSSMNNQVLKKTLFKYLIVIVKIFQCLYILNYIYIYILFYIYIYFSKFQ